MSKNVGESITEKEAEKGPGHHYKCWKMTISKIRTARIFTVLKEKMVSMTRGLFVFAFK